MATARPYWKGNLKLALVSCPIAAESTRVRACGKADMFAATGDSSSAMLALLVAP